MDSDRLPELFGLVVCVGLLILLWNRVLPVTKEKLQKADQGTAKFFLFLLSLPLVGLALHYGFSLMSGLFNFSDPL